MALTAGISLGHYRIVAHLGSGGMGEVYSADDVHLKRRVALKTLRPDMVGDETRRQRFEREAQAVAALNHPNIVTLYSAEHADGLTFLTMELVEGKPLTDSIPPGGVPLDLFFRIAIPLADAVAAAHQRGITHRDLKPANLMLTADSRLKVLDFGLAKLSDVDSPASELTAAPTIASGVGAVVGTVAYMSPEQADGRAVDARSDIFSIGIVLYELLTGQRPFHGDSSLSVMSSILKDTPEPITAHNPSLPRELSQIVRRCLTKDPERRFQTAKDLRNELEELKTSLESGELATAVPRGRRISRWLVAVCVLTAIAGGIVLGRSWSIRSATDALRTSFTPLTTQAGTERFPSLSPDGRWMVYAGDAAGNFDIYLQGVGAQTPINLTKESAVDDDQPAFSPNGERIAFRSERDGGGIFVMGRTGELPRKIASRGFHPAWSPDGEHIVYSTERATYRPQVRGTFVSQLWVVNAAGGDERQVNVHDGVQPAWSPHGTRIAYWGYPPDKRNREIWTVAATGGDPVRVTDHPAVDWNPTWAPDGRHLYFGSNRSGSLNLWRVAIDETSGRLLADAEPVTTPAALAAHFSFAADGSRMVFAAYKPASHVHVASFDPVKGTTTDLPRQLTSGSRTWGYIAVSPDGRQLALTSDYPQEDLFVADSETQTLRQLTDDSSTDRSPMWSPDGGQILYQSGLISDNQVVCSIRTDATNLRILTPRVFQGHPTSWLNPSWAPDGKHFTTTARDGGGFLFALTADGSLSEPIPIPRFGPTKALVNLSSWSPNGRFIAGHTGSGRGPLVIYDTIEARHGSVPIDFDISTVSAWIDDQRLMTVRGTSLVIIDLSTARVSPVPVGRPGQPVLGPALSPDRRKLYYILDATESDLMLMTVK